MHQPNYQDGAGGSYLFPWVYLHALKDYSDMAAHIEKNPAAKAVFNFSPILLEQMDAYATEIKQWASTQVPLKDELLRHLVCEGLPAPATYEFFKLADLCLKANQENIIERYFPYVHLIKALESLKLGSVDMKLDHFLLSDLLVWYHLGWIGESIRQDYPEIGYFYKKEKHFSYQDRIELLHIIGKIIADIIPRYKKLAEAGRIELSFNPYSHPILPLLISIDSAAEAMPKAVLPKENYPDGLARSQWQLEEGLRVFEKYFDFRPKGCWPSEGSISCDTIELLNTMGIHWAASGDSVLYNSMGLAANQSIAHSLAGQGSSIHRVYQLKDYDLSLFFRDDSLSDAIGFEYSSWQAEAAVDDFINRLLAIKSNTHHIENNVISIVMDGENAWEYYYKNAEDFLSSLYQRLAEHDEFELMTFSELLDKNIKPVQLSGLVAGSWVYGSFSTWVGADDKNTAWNWLIAAKKMFDECVSKGQYRAEELLLLNRQLAFCEGSDWFWWYGDDNSEQSIRDFDHLYRAQLRRLYQLLKVTPPEYLHHPFGKGSTHTHGGVMRRGHLLPSQS